ncbi:MAG: cell envelope integrity EipB family protein [Pseudolabrys sp.]|nr:cell envelope integrity EipB family protein [Pseudolabrys sp.]
MNSSVCPHRVLSAAAVALACAVAVSAARASPGAVVLAPHRAIYDLDLVASRGTRNIDAVSGRILYDFSGNACDGYTLQFRQVSKLSSGDSEPVLNDLRSTTWEDGKAKKFRFNSQNLLNEQETIAVGGHADRTPAAVTVTLEKPQRKTLSVPAGAVFPTQHIRRIIEAARAGRTVLAFPVYDGSENGQRLYHTLTVIGKPIAPDGHAPDDAAAKVPELGRLVRWPVTISYFDAVSDHKERSGEQEPVYVIGFELYENGISRALKLDYSDFALAGKLTSLELTPVKPCP